MGGADQTAQLLDRFQGLSATSQPADPLVVDLPSLAAQTCRGTAPNPPGPASSERSQPLTYLLFVIGHHRRFETLSGPVLTDRPAREPFRHPEPGPGHLNGSPTPVRGQNFPVMMCGWCW